jgi:hypothetical protein
MTNTVPFLDRRRLLALLTALPALGRAGAAWAAPAIAAPLFPDSPTLLIAGPDGGTLDRWGRLLQPALTHSLPPETQVRRITSGAPDGVTGANQFDAHAAPDGETVMLAPGEASLAWLVGDPRAQYDVSRWVSVLAISAPGLVMGRPDALRAGRKPRMAIPTPAGGDLPAILGLELLGSRIQPVPALPEGAEIDALTKGIVDVVFLRGYKVPAQARALADAGAQPIFTLGALAADGSLTRCTEFPSIPTFPELYVSRQGGPQGPLFAAWTATAVAAQLDCALVLPQLTPAAMVALWRSAAVDASATLDVQSVALSLGVRLAAGTEATATTRAVTANESAVMELRRWLAARFGWKPA